MLQSNLGSFQYMVDVGVPQEDVAWLQRIANTPGARFTMAAARISQDSRSGLSRLARGFCPGATASVPIMTPRIADVPDGASAHSGK